MMFAVLRALVVAGMAAAADWRVLRKENAASRWIAFILHGCSVLIWIYVSVSEHVSHPSVWVEKALRPFRFFSEGG